MFFGQLGGLLFRCGYHVFEHGPGVIRIHLCETSFGRLSQLKKSIGNGAEIVVTRPSEQLSKEREMLELVKLDLTYFTHRARARDTYKRN